MQRSDSSEHSPVAAKLALHLPFQDVQLVFFLRMATVCVVAVFFMVTDIKMR